MSSSPGWDAQIEIFPTVLTLPTNTVKLARDYVSIKGKLKSARKRIYQNHNNVHAFHPGVVELFLNNVGSVKPADLKSCTRPIPALQHVQMQEFLRHLASVVDQRSGYQLAFLATSDNKYVTQGEYALDIANDRFLKLDPARVEVMSGSKVTDNLPNNTPFGMGGMIPAVDGSLKAQDGKMSRRNAKCIVPSPTGKSLFLLESDSGDKLEASFGPDVWRRIYGSLPFGVASVVNSGGKSEHVLMVTNATIQKEISNLKWLFAMLGADDGAFISTQITRLGGANRGDRIQEWLFRGDGNHPLPSAVKPAFVSVQDFVDRLSSCIEQCRKDIENEIHKDQEWIEKLTSVKIATTTPSKSLPSKPLQSNVNKITKNPRPVDFKGVISRNPDLLKLGSEGQKARQAAFGVVMQMRSEVVKKGGMRAGDKAPMVVIDQAAAKSGFTSEYVEQLYATYPIKSSKSASVKNQWIDYDGMPFGPLAKPAAKKFLAPYTGPTRMLPHKTHWGGDSKSVVQLFNEFGHSCSALEIICQITQEEELVLLQQYWKNLHLRKPDMPFERAIMKALGVPAYWNSIAGHYPLSEEARSRIYIPQSKWNVTDPNPQVRKAAMIRELHKKHTNVAVADDLQLLLEAIRQNYPTDQSFLAAIKRDIRRRFKKWPRGIPKVSSVRLVPLYKSLVQDSNLRGKRKYFASEVLEVGRRNGSIHSIPGTRLSRQRRIVIKDQMGEEERKMRKQKSEQKMTLRALEILEAFKCVAKTKLTKERRSQLTGRRGKPGSLWLVKKPGSVKNRFIKIIESYSLLTT